MLIVLIFSGWAVWQTNQILNDFSIESDTYDTNVRAALELQVDFKNQTLQWKNILLRANSTGDVAEHWAEFQRLEKEIDEDGASLITRLEDSKAAPLIRDFLVMHKNLSERYRKSMAGLFASPNDTRKANILLTALDEKPSESLKIAVDLISAETEIFSKKLIKNAWRTTVINFMGMFITLLVASLLFLASLKKYVLTPIRLLSNFALNFGSGDHSQHIDFQSNDEFGTLTETFNQASGKISSLITNLETSKLRYRNLIQGIDAIIWELDPQTNLYTFVSDHAEDMLGYPLVKWFHEPKFFEKYCHPDDLAACQEKILDALKCDASGEYTCRAIAANGSTIWLNNRIKIIRDVQTHSVSILGVMVDITRMKQYEDRMAYLSTHDELTGLANRNLLADRLERAVARAKTEGNMIALMLVNLDRFKSINESLGHKLGDEVIKLISLRLQVIISTGDTLAHLGADEFAVVLRNINRPEDAAETAREILQCVELPLIIEGNSLVTNCSIGISIYPKDGLNSSDLLRNAGSALTRVKQQGKNNFKFYTEEMNAMALFSLQLENKMRGALEKHEFVLYYQPQINLSENRIIGVEALIRCIPAGEPMVFPMDFIPLAEETMLILPIGEWVLWEACRQNKEWQDKGLAPLCIAVNLSASQFAQPDIIQMVARALHETGLAPQYLELEITESVMMHDMELVIKNLEALHELGIKLAIDDFGTGYSSLCYLKRLPIDKLKVDKSFVQDISFDSDDEAIVSTIIAMAHNLKMSVIAEGVETETQLQYLRDRNCDEVQGYFYSKPLTADQLESYIRHHEKESEPISDGR